MRTHSTCDVMIPAEVLAVEAMLTSAVATEEALAVQRQTAADLDRAKNGQTLINLITIGDGGLGRTAARMTVKLAATQFSPAGKLLTIDPHDNERLTPSEVWIKLEQKYGSGAGERAVFSPLANVFRYVIDAAGDEMKLVGGRVSLKREVYHDTIFNQASFSSRETLQAWIDGIRVVATRAGMWDDRCEANALDISDRLNSRGHITERMSIGALVLIVPCKSSWDFRFTPDLATQIRVFVSDFGRKPTE